MFFGEPDIDGALVGGAALDGRVASPTSCTPRAQVASGAGPVLLVIMDGYGLAEPCRGNADHARAHAQPRPAVRRRTRGRRCTCSGLAVGLPEGQMGNSEVGHLNIGAGRVVYQEFTRDQPRHRRRLARRRTRCCPRRSTARWPTAAPCTSWACSPTAACTATSSTSSRCCAWRASAAPTRVFVHAFLDGRDVPPKSGLGFVEQLEAHLRELGVGRDRHRHGPLLRDGPRQALGARREGVARDGARRGRSGLLGRGRGVGAATREGVTDEFVVPAVVTRDGEPVGTHRATATRSSSSTSARTAPARSRARSSTRRSTGFERPRLPAPALRVPHRVRPDDPGARRLRQGPAAAACWPTSSPTRACASCTSPRPRSTRTSRSSSTAARSRRRRARSASSSPARRSPTYDMQPEMSEPDVTERARRRDRRGPRRLLRRQLRQLRHGRAHRRAGSRDRGGRGGRRRRRRGRRRDPGGRRAGPRHRRPRQR